LQNFRQDINLGWYPLICDVTTDNSECGPSIIVFYDDAQNVYAVKRPGTAGAPPWKELLGAVPHPRGLRTVMRVGHRNTNEILTFSYNLLLGAFAERNPQMAEFAGLAEYEKETIPDDASLDHPRAGTPCVERLDDRQYCVNFAVSKGPPPDLHVGLTEELMLNDLANAVKRLVDPEQGNVDSLDILVMTPEKEQARRVASTLASCGIDTHVPVNFDYDGSRRGNGSARSDPRDMPFFQPGKVTVSTIKSAKGYTAHVCHVAFVHTLDIDASQKERRQQSRSQLHVACTRSSLRLELWGLRCPLMNEAEDALAHLASCRESPRQAIPQ
jgi:hypothetical protein